MSYLQFESDTWWLRAQPSSWAKSDSPLAHSLYLGELVMTVDSSYNSVTRHPMSFWGSQLLKNSHSLTSFVSLGSTGAWPLYCTATVSHSTNIEFHACVCVYFGHHHQPYSHPPTFLTSQHQSLGVLCAHLEWLCRALSLITGWVPLHAFLLQHGCQMCAKPC